MSAVRRPIENYHLAGVYITPKKVSIEFSLDYTRNHNSSLVDFKEEQSEYNGYHDNAGLYIMIYRSIGQLRRITGDMQVENAVVGYLCRECGFSRHDYNKLSRLPSVLDKVPQYRITECQLDAIK